MSHDLLNKNEIEQKHFYEERFKTHAVLLCVWHSLRDHLMGRGKAGLIAGCIWLIGALCWFGAAADAHKHSVRHLDIVVACIYIVVVLLCLAVL